MPFETYLKDVAPWLLHPYYGVAVWVWFALPILLVTTYIISAFITRACMFMVHAVVHNHKDFLRRYILPLQSPVELWLGMVLFAGTTHLLPMTKSWQKGLGFFIGTIATFAVIWACFRLVTITGDALRERFIIKEKKSAAALIPLMRKLLKALLVIMALLFLLQNWGFDVAALLAGLGIGGIAIALASQKTVENLFGGVSVTLDQPVRVGDFIKFGDMIGSVEDIGLRSVTIRTPQRTLVTVPNAQFSEMQLENFAARDKLMLSKVMALDLHTTADQIRYIVMMITEYLIKNPLLDNDCRVRFTDIGQSSLNIEIFGYVRTTDWNEFLAVQEEVYLKVIEIIREAGSQIALPSSTVFLERGKGIDAEQQKAISEKWNKMRQSAEIFYPFIPSDVTEKIADSLPNPLAKAKAKQG